MMTMMGNVGMLVVLVCIVTLSEQSVINSLPNKRATSDVATCTAEFQNIPGHTMCMEDDPRVEQTGVSAQDIQVILSIHNTNRSNVRPEATDLAPLVWNDKIAAVAQKYAQTCPSGHDKQRWVPSLGLSVGQNLAYGQASWADAVLAWSAEEALYTYGMDLSNQEDFKKVGHYTQMVQSNAFLIGCGFATCRNTYYTRYYVCNYAAGQSNPEKPYTKGTRCSACPQSCKNGLCDCGGLVCLNGGTMDLDKCTCQCQPMYKGNNCSEVDCSQYEPSFCSNGQNNIDCNNAYFYALCPVTCGRCPPKEPYKSPFGCQYLGPRYTAEQCNAFGEYGFDKTACASRGGNMDCDSCKKYSNVAKDYCPVQCGICDPREPHVSDYGCKFYGQRATAEQCAGYGNQGNDRSFCGSQGGRYGCSYCAYSNFPTQYCPVMCGLCD